VELDSTNRRKFTASGTIGNSTIQDSGTALTFGVASTFSSTVGVGNAISAWGTGTFPRVLQVGNASLVTNGAAFAQLSNNIYFDGSSYRYITSNGVSRFIFESDGSMTFNNAVSGTAGNTVSTNERMRITSAGNVGIGTSSPAELLHVQAANNVIASILIRGGKADVTSPGEINSKLDFGGNDTSVFSNNNVGGRIASVTEVSNGAYVGMAFYTYLQGRSPDLKEAMRITASGNVGIGTTSPSAAGGAFTGLDIRGSGGGSIILGTTSNPYAYMYGEATGFYIQSAGAPILFLPAGTERMRINSNGNISINYAGDAGYRLYVSGAIYATSNITANSDLTLKKNLKLIDNPIDKLMSLNGYLYQWKENNDYQYGVIAQEVEKILPYAVSTGNDGIKGVSYNQLTPLLIEGFKSHESEITILKARVKYLESKLA